MDPTSSAHARSALATLVLLLLSLAGTFLLGPASQLRGLAGGQLQPDLAFLATPAMLDGYLRALGEAGRQLYGRAEWLDLANALMVALAGGFIIRWLASQLPTDARWPRWLILLPALAGLLDLLENALILRSLRAYPALSPSILPWITSAKLLLILGTLLAIAALAAIALRLRRLAPVEM
jgi:hypothetical protein